MDGPVDPSPVPSVAVKASRKMIETGTRCSIAELPRLGEAREAALPHVHDLEPVLDGLSQGRVHAQPEQPGYAKES